MGQIDNKWRADRLKTQSCQNQIKSNGLDISVKGRDGQTGY